MDAHQREGPAFQLEPFSPRARRREPINANEAAYKIALRAYPGRMSLPDLEGLACAAWDAGQFCLSLPDPRWLLRRFRVRYRPGRPAGSAFAQLLRRLGRDLAGAEVVRYCVVYRASLGRRALGCAFLHEFAHVLLDGHEHDERDVWLLTLALAFPLDELQAIEATDGWTARSLARHQLHADGWALRERAWMARLMYRAAA
jgi:hypothetical protein